MIELIGDACRRMIGQRVASVDFIRPGAWRRVGLFNAPWLVVFVALGLGQVQAQQRSRGSDAGLDRLEAEVARLATITTGTVGVTAIHIETGREIHLNAGERFPMASTFKLPLAVQLLTLVDQGAVSLDKMIPIRPSDLHPGSSMLSDRFSAPGIQLSLRNLLELMLIISDNSAADVIWREAGGARAIAARLAVLNVSGMIVDYPTFPGPFSGIEALPPEAEWTPELLNRLLNAVPAARRLAEREAFYRNPPNAAQPEAMARLLERLWRQELLSPERSRLLLDIMYQCESGPGRLKGMLRDVRVAHKTGSLTFGVTNDVGIIDLPDKAGHVVVVVFIKQSVSSLAIQEQTIAHIARAIYDYFLFNPIAKSQVADVRPNKPLQPTSGGWVEVE